MLILTVKNRYTRMKNVSRKIIMILQSVTSYEVENRRRWKEHEKLLKYSKKIGYHFPTGLLTDVVEKLKEEKIKHKIKDKKNRPKTMDRVFYSWNTKIKLRPYQEKAAKKIIKGGMNSLSYGSGILKMPIRSGKTKTVAWIIGFLSTKALVIVPSKLLLHQTKKSLEESLLCDVGLIGDGLWEERDVTVATAQTLSKLMRKAEPIGERKERDEEARKKWKRITSEYPCVVFDEAHHLTAETWHKVMMKFNAPHKIGLSATAFPEMEKQWKKGAIWLKACCGQIRVDIPTSDLINSGFLLSAAVRLYKIKYPKNLSEDGWSQELRNAAIYENEYRNKKITKIAKKYIKKGLLVLVITNRLNQVEMLSDLFDRKKLSHHTITSRDPSSTRAEKVKDFTDHSVQALIGTVLSEGVDIPEIDVVINAEGGSDVKSTIQKMRNLTISEGKKKAYVVDFIDLTNRHFTRHSRERLNVYESEDAFDVKIIKTKKN